MNIALRALRPRVISFSITCAMLVGCWNVVGSNAHALDLRKGRTRVARLGREFKLRARHQVTLKGENLRIKFAAVTEDSRCPADVQCIWAGNAAVRLDVSILGRGSKSLTLNTHRGSSLVGEARYRGYKVKLVELSPYPRSNHEIAANDYVVTLLVSKN